MFVSETSDYQQHRTNLAMHTIKKAKKRVSRLTGTTFSAPLYPTVFVEIRLTFHPVSGSWDSSIKNTKLTLEQAKKDQRGSTGIALLFL